MATMADACGDRGRFVISYSSFPWVRLLWSVVC
jgi:hypothetical protein